MQTCWSLPARGVWIEIVCQHTERRKDKSLPARGVWIEIKTATAIFEKVTSLPARGVWIEIPYSKLTLKFPPVTPREGGVD